MEALAELAELELFVGDSIDPAEGRQMLDLASGEVRAYCGQDFTPMTDDELVLDGSGSRVLLLPELPVLDVSLVEVGLGGARETLAGPESSSPAWEWNEDGILERIDGGVWPLRRRFVRAVYSHGWEPIDLAVKGVVLRVAGRSLDAPTGGERSETLGRYSYTIAGAEAGIGLFAPDRVALAPYKVDAPRRPRPSSAGSGSGS